MPESEDRKSSNQWKEYEKWKNSIEGILYDLGVFGEVNVEDEKCTRLIAKTLQRLPRKVREKVLDEVTFVIAGTAYGTIFDMYLTPFLRMELASAGIIDLANKDKPIKLSDIENVDLKKTFILLNFTAMEKESEDIKMSTIAHEIAHFILGHQKPDTEGSEKEADDLIEKWGFKRAYESYES